MWRVMSVLGKGESPFFTCSLVFWAIGVGSCKGERGALGLRQHRSPRFSPVPSPDSLESLYNADSRSVISC